jgi:hypothetical protein
MKFEQEYVGPLEIAIILWPLLASFAFLFPSLLQDLSYVLGL